LTVTLRRLGKRVAHKNVSRAAQLRLSCNDRLRSSNRHSRAGAASLLIKNNSGRRSWAVVFVIIGVSWMTNFLRLWCSDKCRMVEA